MPKQATPIEGPELPPNWTWQSGQREEYGHAIWASGPNGHPDAWIKDGEMIFDYFNGGRPVPLEVVVALMRRAGFRVERADHPENS